MWHEPVTHDDAVATTTRRALVYFDELTFDVSAAGVPRAYYFDYDQALKRALDTLEVEHLLSHDQALRDGLETVLLGFRRGEDGGPDWQPLRARLAKRGFELPMRLTQDDSPFYLLQAAYSAKCGRRVGTQLPNLISLANNLFQRHKSALWVWSVMMTHYRREKEFRAHGDMPAWAVGRDAYRRGWRERDPAYAPDRRFDWLLAFLFPEAADALRQDPAVPGSPAGPRRGPDVGQGSGLGAIDRKFLAPLLNEIKSCQYPGKRNRTLELPCHRRRRIPSPPCSCATCPASWSWRSKTRCDRGLSGPTTPRPDAKMATCRTCWAS